MAATVTLKGTGAAMDETCWREERGPKAIVQDAGTTTIDLRSILDHWSACGLQPPMAPRR